MACTVGAIFPASLLGLVWACFPFLIADMRCGVPLTGRGACSGPSVIPYLFFLNVIYLLVPWPVNPRLMLMYTAAHSILDALPANLLTMALTPNASLDRFSC